MTPGFAVFIAGDVLGAASAAIACRRTLRHRGGAAAAREAVVLAASLAVYTAICLVMGYGMWPQALGCLLGAVVAYAGQPWVPSIAEYFTKGDD